MKRKSSHKTSDTVRQRTGIKVEERVYTFFRTPGSYQTSDMADEDDQDVSKIEIDQRHYCRRCKRKRNESKMEKVGKGAFGKDRWLCKDDTASCKKIAQLKGFPGFS